MYREQIQKRYDSMSKSYRKVADFILSDYCDVVFMTAAQLGEAISVDTTTVVRFAQHIGYTGYPALLQDVRKRFKEEVFPVFESRELSPDHPYKTMQACIETDQDNMDMVLKYLSPEQMQTISNMLLQSTNIMLVADGYADAAAHMMVKQLNDIGVAAEFVPQEPVKRSSCLMKVNSSTLVIGISGSSGKYGNAIADVLEFAQERDCDTLGIVGNLASPLHRVAHETIFAQTVSPGPLKTIAAIVSVMSGLVQIARQDTPEQASAYLERFNEVYEALN